MSKVVDRVWMLVGTDNNVIYEIGTSASEVWRKTIRRQIMGTGKTKEDLKREGYRAKKVSIVVD